MRNIKLTLEYDGGDFHGFQRQSRLRTVQAMVTHLEKFPAHRARAACERARYYGSYSYRTLKSILLKALDRVPLPTEAHLAEQGRLAQPRYARSADELLPLPLEMSYAPN